MCIGCWVDGVEWRGRGRVGGVGWRGGGVGVDVSLELS